jgi:hypothetical protein
MATDKTEFEKWFESRPKTLSYEDLKPVCREEAMILSVGNSMTTVTVPAPRLRGRTRKVRRPVDDRGRRNRRLRLSRDDIPCTLLH